MAVTSTATLTTAKILVISRARSLDLIQGVFFQRYIVLEKYKLPKMHLLIPLDSYSMVFSRIIDTMAIAWSKVTTKAM